MGVAKQAIGFAKRRVSLCDKDIVHSPVEIAGGVLPGGEQRPRQPNTKCHNNIKKMQVANTSEMAYWYQYITTCTLMNAWDTTTQALNGAD